MKNRIGFGAVIALTACALPAHAGVIGPLFSIQATNEFGTAEYMVGQPQEYSSRSSLESWTLPGPIELTSSDGQVIATLEEASFAAVSFRMSTSRASSSALDARVPALP